MRAEIKRFLLCALTAILLLSTVACGSTKTKKTSTDGNESGITKDADDNPEFVEVEMSLDNIYEYVDFTQTSDGKWIAINKKYDEGYVIWSDTGLDIATEARFDEDGNHNIFMGIFSYAYSEKPEITDVRGILTLARNGHRYIDDDGNMVVECGTQKLTCTSGIKNDDKAHYFDDFPY